MGANTADSKLFEQLLPDSGAPSNDVAKLQKENQELRQKLEEMTKQRDEWKQKYLLYFM
jgi:hypothetical protein